MNKTLTHSMKSYITIFLVGILVGCICRLTDYCPADTLWSFSSIQTLLGFWIITNTIIVLASTSNICAGIQAGKRTALLAGFRRADYLLRKERHHPPWAGVSDQPDGTSAAGCAGAWQAARHEHRHEKLHS